MFISPKKPEAPCRTISRPAASSTAASPSMMAMNGKRRSPTANSTSPTAAERSSPCRRSVANCDADRTELVALVTLQASPATSQQGGPIGDLADKVPDGAIAGNNPLHQQPHGYR